MAEIKVEKNWTWDEAFDADDVWNGGKPIPYDKDTQNKNPSMQWVVLNFCDVLEEWHRDGVDGCQLRAIYLCLQCDVTVPPWAAEAFKAGWESVMKFEHESWDGPFGTPHRGKQKPHRRFHVENDGAIFDRIRDLKRAEPKRGIGEIKRQVAEEFNTSYPTVRRIWEGYTAYLLPASFDPFGHCCPVN